MSNHFKMQIFTETLSIFGNSELENQKSVNSETKNFHSITIHLKKSLKIEFFIFFTVYNYKYQKALYKVDSHEKFSTI